MSDDPRIQRDAESAGAEPSAEGVVADPTPGDVIAQGKQGLAEDYHRQVVEASKRSLASLRSGTSPIVPLPAESPRLVHPTTSPDRGGMDYFEVLCGRLSPGTVLLLEAPKGTGKETAAVAAARVYAHSERLPEGESGVFLATGRLGMEESLERVRQIATSAREVPCVFVIQTCLDDFFSERKGAAAESLCQAVRGTQACIVGFSELPGSRWLDNTESWRPVFDWKEVFLHYTSADARTISALEPAFGRQLTGRSVGDLAAIGRFWDNAHLDLRLLEDLLGAETGSRVDQLIGVDRSPSEAAWVIAACLMDETEDMAFEEAVRALCSVQGQDYVPTDVSQDVYRRLGRSIRTEPTEDAGSVQIGAIVDPDLARNVVERFRQIHAAAYLRFVEWMGHNGYPRVRSRATRMAAELCARDTVLWDRFRMLWEPLDGDTYARFLAATYEQPPLADRAMAETFDRLASERFDDQMHAFLALAFGVGVGRRRELALRVVRAKLPTREIPCLILRYLAAYDDTGDTTFELLSAWARWLDRRSLDRDLRADLEYVTEWIEAMLAIGDPDDPDRPPTIFESRTLTDGMAAAWADLLWRVLGSANALPWTTECRWFALFLDLARVAAARQGCPIADWLWITTDCLAEFGVSAQHPDGRLWVFMRWLGTQPVHPTVTRKLQALAMARGGSRIKERWRNHRATVLRRDE